MEIKIWYVRNSKGVSLRQLEKLTGISRSTLNNIENEKISPTLRQLEAIAQALETTISELYESYYK